MPVRPEIEEVNAVTLATRDMARSVRFYERLGFRLLHGGEAASFTSLAAGRSHLNLAARPPAGGAGGARGWSGWGRVVFHVADVDAHHRLALDAGLRPDFPPEDAPWGERYFHITDPDGHELSFARPLAPGRA